MQLIRGGGVTGLGQVYRRSGGGGCPRELRATEDGWMHFAAMSHASALTLPWEAGFVLAERAAVEVAKSPRLREAAASAAAAEAEAEAADNPHDWTREQALRKAEEDGLVLLEAKNQTGYLWVVARADHAHRRRPYQVQYPDPVRRRANGKPVLKCGGSFASAEAAALCVARMPEARAEARRRAEAA